MIKTINLWHPFDALIYVEYEYLELSIIYYINRENVYVLPIYIIKFVWNVRAPSGVHGTIPTLPLARTSLQNSDLVG